MAAWATRVRPQERAPSARALQQALLSTLGAEDSHGTQPIPMVQSAPAASYVAPPSATSPPFSPTMAMSHAAALSQTPPPQSATLPSPRGSSTGKIILAVTAILSVTVLVGITIVMGFAYKACTDQPWMQPPNDSYQPANTAPTKPVPPTNGWLFLSSVQPSHFWTEHQIRRVIEPEVASFESCYEKNVPSTERFDSHVSLMLRPTNAGVVAQVSCSVIADGKLRPDDEFSSCLSGKAAALKFPRPTGRLGFLRTGAVMVQLETRKTPTKGATRGTTP